MARRRAYTKLQKDGQIRPIHVAGMGDVLFRGFQCLSPTCLAFAFVRQEETESEYSFDCTTCGFQLRSGGETKLFDFQLLRTASGEFIEQGSFVILHDDYLAEAGTYKYCLICCALKPVELFGRHSSRQSGYQGECRLCKTLYNGIKNQSRITDQHREAAQRRRLYRQLAGEAGRIDGRVVFDKFGGRCFNCDVELAYATAGAKAYNLDHTLPARFLWAMTTQSATLLCSGCNNQKHDLWPSEFYDAPQLRKLARLTGFHYELLAGPPQLNEKAVSAIADGCDDFIESWIRYPEEIKKVRYLIRERNNVDIFERASHVPLFLRDGDEPEE